MAETKEYKKTYVFGLNQQVRMLKQGIVSHRRNSVSQEEEIKRLKEVCQKNAKEIISLEKMVKKVKRWYQIIIWQR